MRQAIATTLLWTACCSPLAGGELEQLTHDGRLKFTPVLAFEGREVVYAELETPSVLRLTRLHLETRRTEPLHPDARLPELDPAFSADGKVYAFLQTVGALKINLEIREANGTSLGQVPAAEGFSGCRSPAISPDHQRVLYCFAEGGRQQIFEVRTDGQGKRALTASNGINNWPAYSRDGRSLVFGSSRDGDYEIYTMPATGGDAVRLTHSPGQDIRPKFSPDGTRIAFTSHRDGNAELYMMRTDGSELRRITDSPDRDDYAEWRPDGRRLMFISERGGKHDLYAVAVE